MNFLQLYKLCKLIDYDDDEYIGIDRRSRSARDSADSSVVLLFFGGKKIPEMMRGLGKGVRSFKEGMNDIEKVVNDDPAKSTTEENAKEEGEK